ncbi:unnamed protein product [Calypogeia fissa]
MMYSRGNGFDSVIDDGYEVGVKRPRSMDRGPGGPWAALIPRASQQQLIGSYGNAQNALLAAARQPRSFPVVRLRGLPFNSNEGDVCEFFAGLDVVDVLLVERNKQGRFSGDAFVVFGAPTQVDFALQRNRMKIGRRYIEVFRSRKHDYYQAVAANVAEQNQDDIGGGRRMSSPPGKRPISEKDRVEHTGVLKLRGLPFSASKRDIIDFFREYGELTEDNVHIMTLANGRASGEAFVEFATPSEAKAAMNKDKMILGTRYVDLFPSSREEATTRAARAR